MPNPLTTLRAGSVASRLVPLDGLTALADRVATRFGPVLMPAKADQLRRNIERVDRARPSGAEPEDAGELARRGFGSYGRYWAESFRIPHLGARRIDRGFSVEGYDNIARVLASGRSPILVLPHLGGWEWAAAWLSRVMGLGVTAVVERLEPEDVYEWFVDLRSSYGINVVPLGPKAMVELGAAAKRNDVICLLADRDIGGNGIDVEFFGEVTSLPVGPALLARRTGAPLLPTAVYFRGRQRVALVGEPIEPERGSGREENARLTRAVTDGLEALVAEAPDQWHLLEPNWPSDRPATGRD